MKSLMPSNENICLYVWAGKLTDASGHYFSELGYGPARQSTKIAIFFSDSCSGLELINYLEITGVFIQRVKIESSGIRGKIIFMLRLISMYISLKRQGKRITLHVESSFSCVYAILLSYFTGVEIFSYRNQDLLNIERKFSLSSWFEKKCISISKNVFFNEENRAFLVKKIYGLNDVAVNVMPTIIDRSYSRYLVGSVYRKRSSLRRMYQIDWSKPSVLLSGLSSKIRRGDDLLKVMAALHSESITWIATGLNYGESERLKEKLVGLISVDNVKCAHDYVEKIVFLDFVDATSLQYLRLKSDMSLLLYDRSSIGNWFQCPGRFSECLSVGMDILIQSCPFVEKYSAMIGVHPIDDNKDMVQHLVSRIMKVISEKSVARRRIIRKRFAQAFWEK